MLKIIAIITIAGCLNFNIVFADDNPVLDSLIATALENNPEIAASMDASSAAEYRHKAEGWLPDPDISAALSNVPHSSLALDETPMSGIALGISQMIPWPGKLSAKKAVSGLNSEAFRYREQAAVRRVVREVKAAYYDYSFWKLSDSILDQNIILQESLIEAAATKYANGKGNSADVLRAQTELEMMKNRKLEFVKMRRISYTRLASLLNERPVDDPGLAARLPEVGFNSLPESFNFEKAYQINPMVLQSSAQKEIAAKKKSLANSDYWPNLMLGFEYRIREASAMDPLDGEDFVSAKVGLNLPIWFWHNQSNKSRAAEYEKQAAKSEYENILRRLEYDLSSVKYEIDRLQQSYKLYDSSIIPNAESTYEAADIAYRVGKLEFETLLSSQKMLFELQIDKLRIRRDYGKQLAMLSEIAGKDTGEQK